MNKRPNIIVIFTDQQRADTIGYEINGNKISPNLEKIGEEGVKFNYSFTPQPVCGPARACLQTGVYGTQCGIYRNGLALNAQEQNNGNNLATWLRESGYDVGYIGKWHLASNGGRTDIDVGERFRHHNCPIPKELRGGYTQYWLGVQALEHSSHGYNGMEDLSWKDGKNPKGFMFDGDGNKVEFEGYRVDAQTDFVLDYIENKTNEAQQKENEKPWFLFVSYIEPHHQNDHARYEGPKESKELFSYSSKEQVPKDLWGADWLNEGDWKENFPDYLGQCWSLDKNVARIMDKLEENGIKDNTLFIFTSDHGSHFRTRVGEYKRNPADACLHIPMIIHGPGFNQGKKVDELVNLIDLVPTILKASDTEIPDHLEGRALQSLVEEDKQPSGWRDMIFSQISESQLSRCVRTKKWKYSITAPGLDGRAFSRSPIYMEQFLFDLEDDPWELENLIDDESLVDVKKDLRKRLLDKMEKIGEERPVIIQNMEIPKPPILEEFGRVIENEEGEICLKLGEGSTSGMMEMDIPFHELLEEIEDEPIIINYNGEKQYGKITKSQKNGKNMCFEKEEETQTLKEFIGENEGLNHSLSIYYPTDKDKQQAPVVEPKYYLFLYKWFD